MQLNDIKKGKQLIKAKGVSPGIKIGIVRIIDSLEKKALFKEGEIYVSQKPLPEDNQQLFLAGAIISDTGGVTSHGAIVARSRGIPAVVGTISGTSVLKDGQLVVVDGYEGCIYEALGIPHPEPAKPMSLAEKMAALAKARGISLSPESLDNIKKREG